MKQKLITIVLTLIAILAPIVIVPSFIHGDMYKVKSIPILIGGLLLLILILVNYKKLEIEEKDTYILLFFILVFISTILCSDIKIALIGEIIRFEGMLMFATYTCIYIASKKFFEYKNINIFLNIMFYVSLAIGLLGIAQNYFNFPKLYPIFNRGISGTFGNSNFFGSFISIILPITIAGFILKSNKKCFILSNVMYFDMISSGTRSAWVAFASVAIIGFIYLVKQKNKTYWKRTGILLICFVIITAYLFSGISHSSTKRKFDSVKNDITTFSKEGLSNNLGSNRMEIWKMTLKLIAQKPIFGCGPDNLRMGLVDNCNDEFISYLINHKGVVDKAHNEYLQIGATIGMPALAVYLIFIGLILLPKMKCMFKSKTCFIFAITIISYLVQAFFNISTIGVAPLFWMLLGLADNEHINETLDKKL